MVVLIMGEPVDALSFMIHSDSSEEFGRRICKKLKE
jgi:translation elongation factor EF-4